MANEAVGKSISEDCIEFFDDAGKVGINLVPPEKAAFIPRIGEIVYLPGQGSGCGDGTYQVTGVAYIFSPDGESDMPEELGPGVLKKITLRVEKLYRMLRHVAALALVGCCLLVSPPSHTAGPGSTTKWTVTEDKDPMYDTPNVVLRRPAENSPEALLVQCYRDKTGVALEMKHSLWDILPPYWSDWTTKSRSTKPSDLIGGIYSFPTYSNGAASCRMRRLAVEFFQLP